LAVFGGSQGAKVINDAVMSVLPELLKYFQVVHQTGPQHFEEMQATAKLALLDSDLSSRYHPFPFLDALAYQMVGGVSKIVITRAGSSLFEFAAWDVPAVVIPIEKSNGDHQRKNAYAYARTGAGIVIEEPNLTPHILLAEITRIMQNDEMYQGMKQAAKNFYKEGAATQIAEEMLRIALGHEKVEQ
jgi:UDP-N-acetylglucosamine--N-acetylmuramyl-(pentapeptide) pyrophosphoryl-undecaprenol N-acetylglucosamine transferase